MNDIALTPPCASCSCRSSAAFSWSRIGWLCDAVRVLPVGAQIANDLDMIKIFNEYGQHRESFSISKEACLLKSLGGLDTLTSSYGDMGKWNSNGYRFTEQF